MYLSDIYNSKKPVLGLELFPPKPDQPIDKFYNRLETFCDLKPDYFSITYGAGGGTRERTVEIAAKIKEEYGIETMVHFTGIGQSCKDVDDMLDKVESHNLENIFALRGDPPVGRPDFNAARSAYKYASELISHIKERKSLFIAAAAYVEGHPDCSDSHAGLEHLKLKVEAGAELLVTQMFFDNRLFYAFREKCTAAGINCPLAAGIMPVYKADQIKSFAAANSFTLPGKLVRILEKYGESPEDMLKAGLEFTAHQIRDLLNNDVDGIQLFTMNRPKSSSRILDMVGLCKRALTI